MTKHSVRLSRRAPQAFTLVELLVVIAIIGVLVALLLPAIQAAREAARNANCKSNLRQVGVAFLNFESSQKAFPTGGWGYRWMGDPDAGVGPRQPGGWVYQCAPFMEGGAVTLIGKGMKGEDKKKALAAQRSVVLAFMNCPSRRPAVGHPAGENARNAEIPELDAKSDYAASSGTGIYSQTRGPLPNADYTNCMGPGFPDCRDPGGAPGSGFQVTTDALNSWNGIVCQRAGAKVRQVIDGTSNTILAGEKYLAPEYYLTPTYKDNPPGNDNFGDDNPGDNSSMWQGYDQDMCRAAARSRLPLSDNAPKASPNATIPGYAAGGSESYGSAHPSTVNMVYADGSAHSVEFDIDPEVWDDLGNRSDEGQ